MSELQEDARRALIKSDVIAGTIVARVGHWRSAGYLDSLPEWVLEGIDDDLKRYSEAVANAESTSKQWIEELHSAVVGDGA